MAKIAARGIIERVDGKAGIGITAVVSFLACTGESIDAVFGSEKLQESITSRPL